MCSQPNGERYCRFFFHVMASLAQMERELIIERTRAGLEIARKLGRKGGRKRRMTDSKIESAKRLLSNGVPPRLAFELQVLG
jgi:DNA invertase Pin-like site-specific DNA recombinase